MAVDDHLPIIAPLSATSTSSSSSSSQIRGRRSFIQVATDNSATFIPFPINSRQSSLFIPTYRSRKSHSGTRQSVVTTNTQFILNKPKLSNTPRLSIVTVDRERRHSEHRINPILSNSLLNHRKGQVTSQPIQMSIDFSQTTRICLSSEQLNMTSNDDQISTNCTNTLPNLIDKTENNISDKQTISDEYETEENIPCLDKNKYDYITNWLYDVEQAIHSIEKNSKTKRSKNKSKQT